MTPRRIVTGHDGDGKAIFIEGQVFFERITLFTSDDNIFLGRAPATREWNEVIHRQLLLRKFLLTVIADTFSDLLFPP